MRKLSAAIAVVLLGLFGLCSPVASADIDVQPVGAAPTPDGPAPNWIVADMDTGQILAARNEDMRTPPASTIKVLLALVTLD